MKRLDEITIADLMPDSISKDTQVSATARAIDPQLGLISESVDKPLILPAIDDLSAGVLEHLAVQYDITAWDSAWPIETKRAVLKTAIADKRKKGTRGAVERAIKAIAPTATLTEWWQDPSGEMPPHTFKIDISQDGEAVDPEMQVNVIAQVNDSKPVRSHYTFTSIQRAGSGLYFAGVLRAIAYARVSSTEPEPVPPVPPVVETPDYYILDATTGAILHSINSPLSSAKPSAVTITGNVKHIDNPPTPPTPQNEILLGLFYQNDSWQSKTFATNDYWYSGVVNSSDVDYLRSIGLGLTTISNSYGPNGCILYNTGYSFEIIGLYSDLGETPVTYDPANFYISYRNIGNENIFTINNYSAFDAFKTYKVRITKNS